MWELRTESLQPAVPYEKEGEKGKKKWEGTAGRFRAGGSANNSTKTNGRED